MVDHTTTMILEPSQKPVNLPADELSVETASDRFDAELARLSEAKLKRTLQPIRGIDFTSNDYLALGNSNTIRKSLQKKLKQGVPFGAGASRLLRGNHSEHTELEQFAANYFGSEKALYLSSGYLANYGILTTLPKRGDLIVYDALMHASARDGIFASLAKGVKVPHNNADAVETVLSKWTGRKSGAMSWIVVESIYSMDGDLAPLADLFEIADRHGAMLVVDEAHATGVWGRNGRGFTEIYEGHPNLITLHTCGKAIGSSGAIVCASGQIIDYLITRCRPFIYSTAPPPILAVAVHEALARIKAEPQRRQELHQLIQYANRQMVETLNRSGSGSQIIPIIIGDEERTLRVASRLQQQWFDIRAIRPPTVPQGTSRLRISITLNVTETQIMSLFGELQRMKTEGLL